jgi:TPP-dependent pyruvate/acetoin dehydrogenase alpha subunit
MNWELYEVWAVDVNGSEDLIDTTKSLKEAREIAGVNIGDDIVECVIYREDDNGELQKVESIK